MFINMLAYKVYNYIRDNMDHKGRNILNVLKRYSNTVCSAYFIQGELRKAGKSIFYYDFLKTIKGLEELGFIKRIETPTGKILYRIDN